MEKVELNDGNFMFRRWVLNVAIDFEHKCSEVQRCLYAKTLGECGQLRCLPDVAFGNQAVLVAEMPESISED